MSRDIVPGTRTHQINKIKNGRWATMGLCGLEGCLQAGIRTHVHDPPRLSASGDIAIEAVRRTEITRVSRPVLYERN